MAVTACRIDLAERRIEVVESIPRGRGAAQYAPTGTSNSQPQGRIRRDIIDAHGKITLRHKGRLHHIGVGRTHAGTCVILLVQDLQVRIVNAATGELLRELVLDPSRDYQSTGAPKGPTTRPPK